jgi:hypothetical protein
MPHTAVAQMILTLMPLLSATWWRQQQLDDQAVRALHLLC